MAGLELLVHSSGSTIKNLCKFHLAFFSHNIECPNTDWTGNWLFTASHFNQPLVMIGALITDV